MPRAERRGKTCGDVQIRWKFIAAISIFCRDGCTNVAGCKPNCCTQPRATPWGNAPCGVKGVMGYALSARGIFAQAQKCRMYQSRSTFPQGAALGYVQHLGFQPAPTIPGALHKRSINCENAANVKIRNNAKVELCGSNDFIIPLGTSFEVINSTCIY